MIHIHNLILKRAYWSRGEDIGDPLVIQSTLSPIIKNDDLLKEWISTTCDTQPIKDSLIAATEEAIAKGAFGAPFFLITNQAGKEEMFFGSDRMEHIAAFLGKPYIPLSKL